MTYPSSIWSPTTKTDKVDLVAAAHINDPQNEIVGVQTELGLGLKGTAADLATRIATALYADGTVNKGSAFPTGSSLVGYGQLFFRTDLSKAFIYTAAGWSDMTADAYSLVSASAITASNTTGNISIDRTQYYKVRGALFLVSGNDQFGIQFNADTDADTEYVFRGTNAAGTARNGNSASGTSIIMCASVLQNGDANSTFNFEFDIYPQGSDATAVLTYGFVNGKISYPDSAATLYVDGTFSGRKNPGSGAAITSFRIISVGGATFTGNVYLYKITKT